MIRKPYLITQAVKAYITASVLTLTMGQLNGFIDSVFMGQVVGPDALSAITLSMPLINMVTMIYILFGVGASILTSAAIGNRDYKRASAIFSVSMVSTILASVVFSAFAWMGREWLTGLICHDSQLYPLALDYVGWAMMLSFTTVISQTLSQFTDVDGRPNRVMKAMVLTMLTNVLLDVVLVLVFGLGVAGSAMATAASFLVSGLYLVFYMAKESRTYRLMLKIDHFWTLLADNMKNGGAYVFIMLLGALSVLFYNSVVLDRLGPDGMFALSVGSGMLSIGSLFTNGAFQAFIAVGGMLYGQKDYRGMHLLFVRCLSITLAAAIGFMLFSLCFPELLVRLFGAETPELISSSSSALRIMSLMYLPFLTMAAIPAVYQVLGHLKLVGLMGGLYYGLLVLTIWLMSKTDSPTNLWWSFPIAGWSGVLFCQLVVWREHRKLPGTSKVTLIPNVSPFRHLLDISVRAEQKAVEEAMVEVHAFVESLQLPSESTSLNIEVCTEEMLLNIVQHSEVRENHYIDLRITDSDDEVMLILKDDGRPFDPTAVQQKNMGLGLLLARSLCSKMEYNFMYGQNASFLSWQINKQDEAAATQ